jgi:hypothetical protein
MSFIAETFDPSSALSGQINTRLPVGGKFIAWNESIVGINFTFSDGSTQYCPADAAVIFTLPTATPLVSWAQKNVLVSAVGPLSECSIISYYPNEKIVGTYPISLGRITSVGNPIPLTTSASSVVNTGNVANTPVVTGQVSGDGGNALNITNDGQATFGDGMNDGNVNVVGGAVNSPTVNADAVNTTLVNAGTIDVGVVNVTQVDVGSVINMVKGSISRFFFFSGINTESFSHNFGVAPTCVLINYAGGFGVAPTQAIAWSTVDSNTISVVGQTGYSYQGVAIHN